MKLSFGRIGDGSSMVNWTVVSQPDRSVTVTVQGPAQSPLTFGVPWPIGGVGDQHTVVAGAQSRCVRRALTASWGR